MSESAITAGTIMGIRIGIEVTTTTAGAHTATGIIVTAAGTIIEVLALPNSSAGRIADSLRASSKAWSASKRRGSRCFSSELGVPSAERLLELVVEDLGPGLQQRIGTPQRPLHLLLLDEPSADYLVYGRFDECCADRFALCSIRSAVS
jgi:hypothetical protein